MDEKILKILHGKLDEIFVKNDEIRKITSSIDVNTYSLDSQSLWLGILIGRLYNSFYYQHRRVLDRNPTNDEFRKIRDSVVDYQISYSLDSQSLWLGILIGRLYNSFYYQHRRVLDRNPTNDEFLEFVDLIKSNQKNFQEKLGF